MTSTCDTINPAEELGRRLFHKKDVRRIRNGNTDWHRFSNKGRQKLSTDRVSVPSLEEISNIAREESAILEYGSFLGWAKILAGDAAKDGRTVNPSPTERNPYHADIVLPICVVGCTKDEIRHAKELAREVSCFLEPCAP